MKLVAITGGIGSGKSTVTKIIKELGYTVFSADEIYHELIKGEDFVKEIYTALNIKSDAYVFDKELIKERVFNDSEMLKKLNDVTHPKVIKKMMELSKTVNDPVFHEVPLLFEGGFENLYDLVIVVTRNLNSRINSVCSRDGVSSKDVLKKINAQINYEKFDFNAHTLISNDGSLEELTEKVKAVIKEFVKDC